MKPDDVTSKMIDDFLFNADMCDEYEHEHQQEIIAAAFNAVISDDSPITAEWLVANGYVRGLGVYSRSIGMLSIRWDGKCITLLNDGLTTLPTKTIGQLLALHAGLGIGEVEGE